MCSCARLGPGRIKQGSEVPTWTSGYGKHGCRGGKVGGGGERLKLFRYYL